MPAPVTITLPDAGKRFMSMQVISEDHYVPEVVYGTGSYTLTKEKVGTRYVAVAIRTLVDPDDPKDIEQVHALQDAIKVEPGGRRQIRGAELGSGQPEEGARRAAGPCDRPIPDFRKAFGTKAEVDPIRHLIGTAAGWGGNPDKDATYLNITPANNDGTTIYRLTVKDVPVDGSGRSASTMPKAITKRTPTTPIRSTASRARKMPMAPSPSSSAAATARFRTACRS